MVANTEEAMGEYVKALVRLDALDGSRLAATLQVSWCWPVLPPAWSCVGEDGRGKGSGFGGCWGEREGTGVP